MRLTFSGNRRWDRNAREKWKAHGNGCAVGRKAKWVPAIGPRTSGKGDKRGHKTEVRGTEEETGREVQPRVGCRNIDEETGGRSAEEVEGKGGLQRS